MNNSNTIDEKPFLKYQRNEYGLLENINYIFNEDGSVNWRAMIKPEFLYVNKEWFTRFGNTAPTSTEGLEDHQLLIKLSGLKELAKLRGFNKVSYDVTHLSDTHVVAKCQIQWLNNYETGNHNPVSYEDVGNATTENTDSFCHKFLETIACNRAFVRCVRNFLNIHIVGMDEIDRSNSSNASHNDGGKVFEGPSPTTPLGALQKALKEKHGINDFEQFQSFLRTLWKSKAYQKEEVKEWKSFKDIPVKEVRVLMSLL